jgi:hypothetical protein
MSYDELTHEQATAITAAVDIEAAPPENEPVALVLFGTNQTAPARIAAERYHRGAAPLIIATGGVNRHNGIVEGREFARQLTEAGVPASAIRVEDTSANTWQNVELSLPYLREALNAGLPLAAVSKWYHLRTVHCLRTLLPEATPFYAISWEPVYAGTLVTRETWPDIPDGRRRVIRESQEVPRRVSEGSYLRAEKKNGRWWLSSSGTPHSCGLSPQTAGLSSTRASGTGNAPGRLEPPTQEVLLPGQWLGRLLSAKPERCTGRSEAAFAVFVVRQGAFNGGQKAGVWRG